MLHPSYSELMEVINSEVEESEQLVVQSSYSIVKAAAERAKQIIDSRYLEEKFEKAKLADKDGKNQEVRLSREDKRKIALGKELVGNAQNLKPLSVAVKELYEGKVKIVGNQKINYFPWDYLRGLFFVAKVRQGSNVLAEWRVV